MSVPVGAVSTSAAPLPPGCAVAVREGAADNLPDAAAAASAAAIADGVRGCAGNELLLLLISGGGSALLPAPVPSITLEEKQAACRTLAGAGASIQDLNTVRKHLSVLKGGQLAAAVAESWARCVALIISDVVGDPLDVIASGPTVPDSSTFADCLEVVARLGVVDALPPAVMHHLREGAVSGVAAAEPPAPRVGGG